MKSRHWIGVVAGLTLVALAIWQFRVSEAGMQIDHWQTGDLPLTRISPVARSEVERPPVLVGLGFAGSRSVMRSLSLSLAHAGYEVI